MSFALTNPFENLFERGEIAAAINYLLGNPEAIRHLNEKYSKLLQFGPQDLLALEALDPNYRKNLMRKRELVGVVDKNLREGKCESGLGQILSDFVLPNNPC